MTRTAASRCPSTRRQVRDLQRLTHLLGAALLLVYIYVAPHLGAGFVASSFLGLALIFSSRPFYSFYEHTQRLWGLSPIRDQNLGGIVMNGEQTLVFLLAIGWYVWRLLDEEHAAATEETPAAR